MRVRIQEDDADMVGEGTSPLHSCGSGGISPPSSGEIDLIFIVSKYQY